MTRYGPEKFKGRRTLPIKQLIALGTFLCDKIDEIGTLPSDVDFYFEEVIRERAYLSQHFREFRDSCEKDEIDTINHEHFTSSLKQIHKILLTAGKPAAILKVVIRKPVKHVASRSNSINGSRNSFAYLSLSTHDEHESDGSDDETSSDTDTNATSECSHSNTENNTCPCEDSDNDTDFLDSEGSLGVAVETTIYLKVRLGTSCIFAQLIADQDMLQTFDVIKSCWVKAGEDRIPTAAAAAYTNVLLAKAVASTRGFCQTDTENPNLSDVRHRLESLNCDGNHEIASMNHDINNISKALCHVYDEIQSQSCRTVSIVRQAAPSFIEHTANPVSLINELVSSLQHAYECRNTSSLAFDGIPCIAELFARDEDLEQASATLISSVVVYMMSVSHCSYSSTLAQPSHIAMPRIKALKLANEALGVIRSFVDDKSIFPCQCVNTLGYRITQMAKDLEAFAKYKCWNVVSQSPLVAGNHLLEVHDLCSYYGMHLFHYRQYVAAVLHTYQALITLNALERVPILDEICDLFTPVLYTTANRPQSGFMASWLRYIGARLKFKKGKKHQNHKDTWCMSVPAHAAARSAGLNISQRNEDVKLQPKFDYGTIDHIIKMKRNGWVLPDDLSQVLDGELQLDAAINVGHFSSSLQNEEAPSSLQKTRRNKHMRTKSYTINKDVTENKCSKLDHTLTASFTVDSGQGRNLPPSRLNLLSFFHSMTKVVSGISDATHAEDDMNGNSRNTGSGQMCLCFVQTILQASDRILDVRKRTRIDAKGAVWSKNEKECIECYKKFLVKMLEEAKVLDGDAGIWLWSSM